MAIFLIGSGSFLLIVKGIIPILNAENDDFIAKIKLDERTVSSMFQQSTKFYKIQFPTLIKENNNFSIGGFTTVEIAVTFKQNTVFVGDLINYEVTVSVFPPRANIDGQLTTGKTDISGIDVIVVNPQEDVNKKYDTLMVNAEIENHTKTSIHVNPEIGSNSTVDGSMSFSNEGDKVLHVFVTHDYSSSVEDKLDTDNPIFKVYPNTERLQVLTNRDTLEQIVSQHISDTYIVGLSWIAVALAPLVIGGDILLRIYLESYTDEMKNQNLFKKKQNS